MKQHDAHVTAYYWRLTIKAWAQQEAMRALHKRA